jgi:hypothetical protein
VSTTAASTGDTGAPSASRACGADALGVAVALAVAVGVAVTLGVALGVPPASAAGCPDVHVTELPSAERVQTIAFAFAVDGDGDGVGVGAVSGAALPTRTVGDVAEARAAACAAAD